MMCRKAPNSSNKKYHGYVGNHIHIVLFMKGWELLILLDLKQFEASHFTDLMWPQGKSNSCEILHSYVTKVSELEKMLKRMVMESLGVEKYYESHAESISYDLRLMKYKEPMTDESKLGLSPRTDRTFCTILDQNQVNGLEVQRKNGEWIRATPSPSSFIFMVGDAFYAWTNGRVHCPRH